MRCFIYFIIVVFASGLLACKKTEKLKPEVLPDTYVDPTYTGIIESHLNIGFRSNGSDSTFRFNASLWEESADPAPWVPFNKVSYNGKENSTIDQGVKFLGFANNSNWDFQSSYIGNFTHTSYAPTPLISNASGLIPTTFSGSVLNLNLQNISDADRIVVTAYDGGFAILGYSQTFEVNGAQNLSLAFSENVSNLYLNTDIQLTVSFWKFHNLSGSNYTISFAKVTNYIYKTRKTS